MKAPFGLLLDLDAKARRYASGLPAQGDVQNYWNGIGFALHGQHYVAPLDEVQEILHLPEEVTPIPGVYPWVRGVANVRGRLLPLLDLAEFLGLDSHQRGAVDETSDDGRRVMVFEQEELFCGLIVDEVLGMQHFEVESYHSSIPVSTPDNVRFCLAGSYWRESEFLVFSLRALARSERFLLVSPGSTVA